MPNVFHSPALREALGLPASPTPIDARADGETMSQPEARLGSAIRRACIERAAFGFKIHGGPTMMAGLPDLIMCYRGQFIGMEIKMPEGKVSVIQKRRIREIRDAGGRAYVVRSVSAAMRVLDAVDKSLDAHRPGDSESA